MRKTKLPTRLVYGLNEFGDFTLQSDVYFQEGLRKYDVLKYSRENTQNFFEEFSSLNPDVIFTYGGPRESWIDILQYSDHNYIMSKWIHFGDSEVDYNILANDIVCQSTFWSCKSVKEVYGSEENPLFSVFTGEAQN